MDHLGSWWSRPRCFMCGMWATRSYRRVSIRTKIEYQPLKWSRSQLTYLKKFSKIAGLDAYDRMTSREVSSSQGRRGPRAGRTFCWGALAPFSVVAL